ncbi:hypothetical protein QTI66_01095 [Variovorax sp. J22R133]|uniref:hypothetical protein n=1 Tax=Variovorax brevis TaxID=3053503 RepID=UPI0025749184|nr:hypothetical protein [Variovorax sp. J22R133]MDM0110721.1 hypothetical protein [Variovorax sp. J22R133]
MKKLVNVNGIKFLACAVALASMAACGGGGGGNGGGSGDNGGNGAGANVTVSGTAAKGAALVGASVSMECANHAKLTGTTDGNGRYNATGNVVYPCVGTATLGAAKYRGVLFKGTSANFTPLTDALVEVMLAAAGTGTGSMTIDQFLAKAGADATFAANVSSEATIESYRDAVVEVIKAQLIAGGMTEDQANAVLAAADSLNFESATFAIGSDLDKVLDKTADVMQNADGSVKAGVLADAKTEGNTLPVPGSGATGATGAGG